MKIQTQEQVEPFEDFIKLESVQELLLNLRGSKHKNSKHSQNIIEIPFGDDIVIWLPKDNLEEAWEFAQEHMKLYLKKRALKQEPKSNSSVEEKDLQ